MDFNGTVNRVQRSPAPASGRSTARTVPWHHLLVACGALAGLAGCVEKTDADFRAEVAASMHAALTQNLADIVQSAREIQAADAKPPWRTAVNGTRSGGQS